MPKRKSLIFEALERLDGLMAIGEKRSEAKAAAQARGESIFAFSDGRIHSYQTRSTYQATVMRFLHWCRDIHHLRRLDQVDARADELASAYLVQRISEQKSAWTLQTDRSALRCFFRARDLASKVALPLRRRENIVRSRRPGVRNPHFQVANWQPVLQFLQATGLRREEVRDLRVCDVSPVLPDGSLRVTVVRGKGGKRRVVPVFPGREQAVLTVIEQRRPDEPVFARIPTGLVIQGLRRQFARELYEYYVGHSLPLPGNAPLRLHDVDREAALRVSRALGHNRVDVVVNNYLQ